MNNNPRGAALPGERTTARTAVFTGMCINLLCQYSADIYESVGFGCAVGRTVKRKAAYDRGARAHTLMILLFRARKHHTTSVASCPQKQVLRNREDRGSLQFYGKRFLPYMAISDRVKHMEMTVKCSWTEGCTYSVVQKFVDLSLSTP